MDTFSAWCAHQCDSGRRTAILVPSESAELLPLKLEGGQRAKEGPAMGPSSLKHGAGMKANERRSARRASSQASART